QIGDTLFADMSNDYICKGSEGSAALDELAARLAPDTEIDLAVADIGMQNAITLPGGRIVIFRGLIAESSGPDELAGILGHEIAHYRERHVMEAMIRQMTLGLVMASVGGTTGAGINDVAALNFSRDAEREADAEAIAMLTAANISPAPTAEFFRRMLALEEKATGGLSIPGLAQTSDFLSTHPASAGRADRFEAAAEGRGDWQPALDDTAWADVRNICGGAKEETGE
ncbi:MAG: M48 family metallopeptidase, partial [Pacificimonas sp.]